MGIFKRLFKVGEAEAHSAVEKLENPIRMTEQGIRDMKKDLDKSLKALAEVKAMAIRSKKEKNQYMNQAKSFEQKAILLLQKAENGQIDSTEADRLASEALIKKEENANNAAQSDQLIKQYDGNIGQLDQNIKKLKSQISHYENELKTLKARAQVAKSTKKINKSMSNIDSSSTVSMLERMKEKVDKDEAMAEAYGDIANESKSVDDEIDEALKDDPKVQASGKLADLKAKLKNKK